MWFGIEKLQETNSKYTSYTSYRLILTVGMLWDQWGSGEPKRKPCQQVCGARLGGVRGAGCLRCVPTLCSELAMPFPLHSLPASLHHPILQEDFAS